MIHCITGNSILIFAGMHHQWRRILSSDLNPCQCGHISCYWLVSDQGDYDGEDGDDDYDDEGEDDDDDDAILAALGKFLLEPERYNHEAKG